MTISKSQFNFLTSNAKFTGMSGGYKSGKTFIIAHKAVNTLMTLKVDGLMAEPTYRMNEDLLRPALEKAFQYCGVKFRYSASESIYYTTYGRIILRTQDKRDSLEGHNIGWFGLDEVDLLKYDKALENWNVLISKLTLGATQKGFITGTNEGYNFIYEQFVKDADIKNNTFTKDNSFLVVSSTYENKNNLPSDYLETLEKQYDEKLQQRYIHGLFVNIGGMQAAYNYSNKNHKDLTFDINRRTVLCFDFNINPMTCVVNQEYEQDKWCYTKEFIHKESNTTKTTQAIKEYLKDVGYNGNLEVTGDYTGNARKSSSLSSDWLIIMETFREWKPIKRVKVTPSVRARLNAFNKGLEIERQMINPNECKLTNEDWLKTKMEDDGHTIDSMSGKRGHQVDATSYFDMNYYPIRNDSELIYL